MRVDSYIRARKSELAAGLAALGGLSEADAAAFPRVIKLLEAVIHHEAFDRAEKLKDLYGPLDPDGASLGKADFEAFQAALEAALAAGNYMELSTAELLEGKPAETAADLRVRTNSAGIASIRYFARGRRITTLTRKRFYGLSRKEIQAPVLKDLVMLVRLKTEADLDPREQRAFTRLRRAAAPGAVLLKRFADVPESDLASLHPGAFPAMKHIDKAILGVPAIAGGAPLAIQLVNSAPVIFAVLAAYFGAHSMITKDRLQSALAALSIFVALGAFLMRQRLKFDRQRLLYQKQLADLAYFHSRANNSAVLDGLVADGEAQDVKEAVLAWRELRVNGALSKERLDKACETTLRTHFRLDLDFEIGDALHKLERLGLATRKDGAYQAVSGAEALAGLGAYWDALFV